MSGTKTTATPKAAELLVQLLAGADADAVAATDDGTWMAMAHEAARQGVLPLIHARIGRFPVGTVPAEVTAVVRERYSIGALWSTLIFRELDVIVDALAARGIPVVLLKGLHLAAAVYDDPALRAMGDLDVMVPRDRLADASRALTEAGFDTTEVADLDDFCLTNCHLPRMAPPGGRGLGVEVHWTIELPTSPFEIRPAELWASSRPFQVNGRDVLGLSPEHLILHLCLHACYHHRFDHTPLKQLCDVAVTLRQFDGQIDWDLLAGTAERWGIHSFVRFTLLLTREILGAEVPDTIQSLPADADEARLLENARAYILNCTIAMPVAFKSVVRAGSWPHRFRAGAVHMFPSPARMAAIYGTPRSPVRLALLYVMRPFDLLRRKGWLTLELLLPGRTRRRMRYTEQNRLLLKHSLNTWAREAGVRDNSG
ncbi:MAG TPA: nucleotidyltransferase family protein [Longimicrobiales bacterium]|nr:nucleotidyltransferase family protein [Longimicrobiales bacterium]